LADDRVKQVKEANDIVDVVGGYLALRPAGATYKGLCPFHEDSRPSFDVDPRRQRYRCWACGKYGDVISFVQEHERISFPEALELLARRAGITLEPHGDPAREAGKAQLLDVARWVAQQYHECLLDSPLAEEARHYLGGRGLKGETVRRYGLGFAPRAGDWLVQRAEAAGVSAEMLEKIGLLAPRQQRAGWYDRFRDRVLFPIRDTRGQTVAFGGRILPSSPLASRGPKYYNSTETPLFSKSDHLYGLDQARHAAGKAGYLAVVEGYTDVLMAHQAGVGEVVATMGTALNPRHVHVLRRFAPRVVLVFDADVGGDTGVDRALEIFAGQDVDLRVATLPPGLDPCDLLVGQGADAFRRVLEEAVDALEFKMNRVLGGAARPGIEECRRAVDAVLGVIALAPPLPGQAGALKAQLIIGRIARRLALKEENVWARLEEIRARKRDGARGAGFQPAGREGGRLETCPTRTARALPEESQLLQVLLAEPALVPEAQAALAPDEIEHPGLRKLLEGLYALHSAGEPPTLDQLRPRLDNVPLAAKALELQDIGRANPDRPAWLRQLLHRFQERRLRRERQELHDQLHAASDHAQALELLRQLQHRHVDFNPGSAVAEAGS
jgi:DNA primase